MISKKVILTGSFGVGKTSLFNKFIFSKFSEKYLSTIGVTVNKKVLHINGVDISIMLWDIAGEVTQDKIPVSYFLNTDAVLYVFDVTRPLTYKDTLINLEFIRAVYKGKILKIVANKADLLSEEKLAMVKEQVPVPWDILTSAKTGFQVEELFETIGIELLEE